MPSSNKSAEIAVRAALERLKFTEKEIIIRYYFMGQTSPAIGAIFRLPAERIVAIKKGAVNKLKIILTPFAEEYYGHKSINSECPLCRDKRLDTAIIKCAPMGPWSGVMRKAKSLKISGLKSISTIIYHYKYHICRGVENGRHAGK